MKIIFLSNHPHPVHAIWAESINAKFMLDRVRSEVMIPKISRIIKSISTFLKIPKDTDVVLCESSSQLIAGVVWKIFNKKKKLVSIVSDPTVYYLKEMNKLKANLYIWMLNKTDLLIPTSPLMLSIIPKNVNVKKLVVPPYADTRRYSRHNASLDKETIVSTGRLSYEKGADRILKTFKILKRENKNAKLYILGYGKLKNSLELEKIDDIIFTGWANKPEHYLKKGSIYLSLARIEPAGIILLEAMLVGLVPVVSKGVGNSYIVKRISKELVVENEEEASRIIRKLWGNKSLLKKYSSIAKKIAKEYNQKESLKKFEEAMKSIGVKEFKDINEQITKKYRASIKPLPT